MLIEAAFRRESCAFLCMKLYIIIVLHPSPFQPLEMVIREVNGGSTFESGIIV